MKRFVREGGALGLIREPHPLHEEVLVAQDWRSRYSSACVGVRMGTTSMASTCDVSARVSQRHKRLERIVQKLARPGSPRLSVMQDIAGVRAVVGSLSDLRCLEEYICSRWTDDNRDTSGRVVAVDDYVTRPRDSGYRAVHLMVEYNGRLAELQLRTQNQHEWADLVETVSHRIGVELKAGRVPDNLSAFFVDLGELIERLDNGEPVTFERRLDLTEWVAGAYLTVEAR